MYFPSVLLLVLELIFYIPSSKEYKDRLLSVIEHDVDNLKIPKKFDSRQKWPYCNSIRNIFDRRKCDGLDWVFAAVSIMSDRMCISTKGKFNQLLSVQDILECCVGCMAILKDRGEDHCSILTGLSQWAFKFWTTDGVVTGDKGCKPFDQSILDGKPVGSCRKVCTNTKYNQTYVEDKIFAAETKHGFEINDIRHIQAEIMLNGPVATWISGHYGSLYDNITPNTIITSVVESQRHDHYNAQNIKIIGWDVVTGVIGSETVDKVPVWIIANSKGTTWANKGFGYIRRGKNDFNCETRVATAIVTKPITTTTTIKASTALVAPEVANGSKRATSLTSVTQIVIVLYLLKLKWILND